MRRLDISNSQHLLEFFCEHALKHEKLVIAMVAKDSSIGVKPKAVEPTGNIWEHIL
jgi:hypothetical protein